MGLSDYFRNEGKYLRADDVPENAEIDLTIVRVEIELIEHDDKKREAAVVYFQGKEKGLVLNATNGKKLVDAYGDEKEALVGKDVILYRDTVDFKGQRVPCLRVRIPTSPVASDDVPF